MPLGSRRRAMVQPVWSRGRRVEQIRREGWRVQFREAQGISCLLTACRKTVSKRKVQDRLTRPV